MQSYTLQAQNRIDERVVNGSDPLGYSDINTPDETTTVTVRKVSDNSLATLFSDNGVTPTTNPLNTDFKGKAFFYAANDRYNIIINEGDPQTEETIGDVVFYDPTETQFTEINYSALDNPLCHIPFNINETTRLLNGSLVATRSSIATYIDIYNDRNTAAINEIRKEKDGLLHEGQSTNLLLNSDSPATQPVTITAGNHTLWVEGSGSADTIYGSATEGFPVSFVSAGETLTVTVSGSLNLFQLEPLPFQTSYITTLSTQVTRNLDSVSANPLNNAPKFNEDWSVSFKIKAKPTDSFAFIYNMSTTNQFRAYLTSTSLIVDNGTMSISHQVSLDDHITITFDSGLNIMRLYYSGLLVSQTGSGLPLASNPDLFVIGRRTGSTSPFYGNMSDFRVYIETLSESQVAFLGTN